MKNSLLALLWAIAILPLSAQKTLPRGIQYLHAGLNIRVAESLKKAGFDLSACPSKMERENAQERSGQLQLDSTKTFYGYDFVGPSDSLPIFRTVYQYPQPAFEIQTEYQIENDTWTTLSRSNISKDNQGRIVEVNSEVFDAEKGDFVPDSRVLVYPHADTPFLLDSFYVFGWDTLASDWLLIFYNTNEYDAQDRLLTNISSFDYFGQPLLFKDVYTYDANGDNTLIETSAIFDGAETPSGKSELKYANHLPTQEVAFVIEGLGDFIAQSKITYAYTSFDKVEQVNNYEWSLDANDWVQKQGDTYGYDSDQRQNSKETILFNQDGSEERELLRYDYVEDDKLASEALYLWDGNYFLSDRTFYYYSDGTLGAQEPNHAVLPLKVAPNPTTGLVSLSLEAPATIRIYNPLGELVSSREYQPNNPIHVNDLPDGLYFISARSENEQYVGQLVKE